MLEGGGDPSLETGTDLDPAEREGREGDPQGLG